MGATWLIEGEAGIGKTALLEACVVRARQIASVTVCSLRGDAMHKHVPFFAWRAFFRLLFKVESLSDMSMRKEVQTRSGGCVWRELSGVGYLRSLALFSRSLAFRRSSLRPSIVSYTLTLMERTNRSLGKRVDLLSCADSSDVVLCRCAQRGDVHHSGAGGGRYPAGRSRGALRG